MKKNSKLAGTGAVACVALMTVLSLQVAAIAQAADAQDHPAVKRPFDLPPSAELDYSINARQRGFNLSGDATVTWRQGEGKYAVDAESRVALLGKLTETRSSGAIDNYGLAPTEYSDKRLRKDAVTATFDRDARSIHFSDGKDSYPIKGGEQDRASMSWQLVAIARAAKDKFKDGSEWQFFVVGPHDADPWTFRVVGREKVQAGAALGEVDAVHVMRAAPPGSKDQTLDIWLAPGREWYPVKLRFTDNDRDYVEQTLEKIVKK